MNNKGITQVTVRNCIYSKECTHFASCTGTPSVICGDGCDDVEQKLTKALDCIIKALDGFRGEVYTPPYDELLKSARELGLDVDEYDVYLD